MALDEDCDFTTQETESMKNNDMMERKSSSDNCKHLSRTTKASLSPYNDSCAENEMKHHPFRPDGPCINRKLSKKSRSA